MRDRRSSSSYVDPAPVRVVSVSNKGVGVYFLLTFFVIQKINTHAFLHEVFKSSNAYCNAIN